MVLNRSLIKNITGESFDNDATTKLLGFDYQKLIALQRCLDAKSNEYIWIECKGDVADKDTSIEVKHHNSKNNLTGNSVDVWKTIKNYVENFNVVKTFNHLILYTTSSVSKNSIFYGWNDLTTCQKKNKLLGHVPSESIKVHHEKIRACSTKDLQTILERFSIISDRPKILEKWEELKAHSAFILVPNKFRDEAIKLLYGYITKEAIENPNMWQININDFQRDIRHTLSKFTNDKIPFHLVLESEIKPITTDQEFQFLRKMKDVNLKSKEQQMALTDYLRAQISQMKMLSLSPTISMSLEQYDETVQRMLTEEKSSNSYNLNIEEIAFEKVAMEQSRKLYFDCIKKPHDQIIGVNDTQKYYKDGRIHHIAEISNFEWKYCESDL
jgi:hypothetical protein